MKKTFFLILGLLVLAMPLYASYEERSTEDPLVRSGIVFKRGVMNLAGLPAEVYATTMREMDTHPKIWPVTFLPRILTNVIVRGASAINDTLISPLFYAPFTTDITPMTEPMGLPEYPWETDL